MVAQEVKDLVSLLLWLRWLLQYEFHPWSWNFHMLGHKQISRKKRGGKKREGKKEEGGREREERKVSMGCIISQGVLVSTTMMRGKL